MTNAKRAKRSTESRVSGPRQGCPECRSANVARIQFGMPAWSRKVERDLASGRIALGGCAVTGDDPDRRCNECGHIWRSARGPALAGQ
jgi:hypothetical protein